jgi:hypothetical protein
MYNPLASVPTNHKKVYVAAYTKDGCTVYMPVDSFDVVEQIGKKLELQKYLDSQPTPTTPTSYA